MKTDISTTTDLDVCLALRRRVFIEEQGVSEAEEIDGLDDEAVHLLARIDGHAVGTARLLLRGETGKIGRVCVLREARGTGLGVALIKAALAHLRARGGIREARLSAQSHAIGFYERLGFTPEGAEFLDAGIPHRHMRRAL
ncbi:MAG: GNAT family N-acetyltransferase [Pararhodobacter sp.]